MPATKVLANVYQLYMVEYQCASRLMSHSHGMEDSTVRANSTMKTAAHTVLFQIYFFPSSTVGLLSSMLRESWRTFFPSSHQPTMVMMVQTVKNFVLRKPDLCTSAESCAASGLAQR